MDKIIEGVNLEDGFIKVDDVPRPTDDKSVLGVELHSGKPIVRRLFEHLGYRCEETRQSNFAGLTKKDLPKRSLEISEWDGDCKSENDYRE